MPLTPINYTAICDVPDCTQQALGTLQHLSTKGWNLKVLYLGAEGCEVALFSVHDNITFGESSLICPECSVLGRYK